MKFHLKRFYSLITLLNFFPRFFFRSVLEFPARITTIDEEKYHLARLDPSWALGAGQPAQFDKLQSTVWRKKALGH